MKSFILAISFCLILTSITRAQNYFSLLNAGKNVESVGINANPHLNMNADYLYALETNNNIVERFGIISQANFPLFSQKGFDFDIRIGAGVLLGITNRFKAITGLSWNFSKTADLNGRYFHSGFKLDLLPGYYGNNWSFSPHFSVNYQPWVNIKHSAYVKQAFNELYPNGNGKYIAPKDGWFSQKNITIQTGMAIAYFQPKWHFNLTAGFQKQPNHLGLVALPDIGILPFYGGLNFGYSIPDKK